MRVKVHIYPLSFAQAAARMGCRALGEALFSTGEERAGWPGAAHQSGEDLGNAGKQLEMGGANET